MHAAQLELAGRRTRARMPAQHSGTIAGRGRTLAAHEGRDVIPKPRGSLSEALFTALAARSDALDHLPGLEPDHAEDAHIALWALHELSYRGLDGVEEDLEWHPDLLRLRSGLEGAAEAALRARWTDPVPDGPFEDGLFGYIEAYEGPSLSPYLQRRASEEQVLDLLRHRSIYHLKETDPTAWVLPRLPVVPQAALMELLYDEYGGGDPNRLHSHLFARGMEAVGLRTEYPAYIDEVPVEILEQNNAMSIFGLHRRLRGAALGHLAAFEVTSSLPSRRIAQGLARLGMDRRMVAYYEEHVEADAVHEQLAVRTICASLVRAEPTVLADVFFGAFTCLDLESRYAARMLRAWEADDA